MKNENRKQLDRQEKIARLHEAMPEADFVKFVGAGRTLWGVRRREDGIYAAAHMTMLDAAGYNIRTAKQESGDCPITCPKTVFEMLTPPEGWPMQAEGREEACLWYAAVEGVRRRERDFKDASAFIFPDCVSTSRGLVNVVVPLPGACSVNIPAGDSIGEDIGRGVGMVMTRKQADDRGAIPLESWCRDLWDSVSQAIVVLDYREVGRGDHPVVHATCNGTFNGIPFTAEDIDMKAWSGLHIKCGKNDDLERDIICTDIEPVYQSGMRGALLCSQPVRVVEIACGVDDGKERVRARYPRNEQGRWPWLDSYELMVAVLRERMAEGTVSDSVFMDEETFAHDRYGQREDENYARQMTQVPLVLEDIVAQARNVTEEEAW